MTIIQFLNAGHDIDKILTLGQEREGRREGRKKGDGRRKKLREGWKEGEDI